MKWNALAVSLALAASGCGQEIGDGPEPAANEEAAADTGGTSVGTLLREGNPIACAHPAVKKLLAEQVVNVPGPGTTLGGTQITIEDIEQAVRAVDGPTFSEFQATGIDKDARQIACEMNSRYETGFGQLLKPREFILRSSLENPDDFILKADLSDERSGWRSEVQSKANEFAKARQATEPTDEPATTETGQNEALDETPDEPSEEF